MWKPAELTRGQIIPLHMGLFCFRQVSNRSGHVSVTWKEQCVEHPGARWVWPPPPAPALSHLQWVQGGSFLSKCPRERPHLCPSLHLQTRSLHKRWIWAWGHAGLPSACRADISTSQQARWLPSSNTLQGVQLDSND